MSIGRAASCTLLGWEFNKNSMYAMPYLGVIPGSEVVTIQTLHSQVTKHTAAGKREVGLATPRVCSGRTRVPLPCRADAPTHGRNSQ